MSGEVIEERFDASFERIRTFDLPASVWTDMEGMVGAIASEPGFRFQLLLPVKNYLAASLRGHRTYAARSEKWTKIYQGAFRLELLLTEEERAFFPPGELGLIKDSLLRLMEIADRVQEAIDANAADPDFEPPPKEAAGARKRMVSELLDVYVATTGRRPTANAPKGKSARYSGEAFAFIWAILSVCLQDMPSGRTVVGWIKDYAALQDAGKIDPIL